MKHTKLRDVDYYYNLQFEYRTVKIIMCWVKCVRKSVESEKSDVELGKKLTNAAKVKISMCEA